MDMDVWVMSLYSSHLLSTKIDPAENVPPLSSPMDWRKSITCMQLRVLLACVNVKRLHDHKCLGELQGERVP